MSATRGLRWTRKCHKGELEGTMGSSTPRDSRKEQVVSIAALVDVSRTEKSDGGVKVLSMIEI